MDLYIIRHAWAEDRGQKYGDDSLRPLTDEGRVRFRKMARMLAQQGFRPKAIATSPMVRCAETARIAASAVGGKVEVVELNDLLPGGELDRLIEWTARLPKDCDEAAWVGHAPDVNRLCAELLGVSASNLRFPKGAVAALRFDGPVACGEAQLRWVVTAKVIGC